jgi:hypothetical protein
MNRRNFLSTVGASLVVPAWAHSQQSSGTAKLARIAIMTYNFSNILKVPGLPAKPIQTLDVFDLPQMFADRYGVHNIEFQHSHLPISDPSSLQQLVNRIKKVKSHISQINLEFGSVTFSASEPEQREQAATLTNYWIDHAVMLGCPRVMVNQGHLTVEKKVYSIPTLKRISKYAHSRGIKISLESRTAPLKGRDTRNTTITYPPAVLPLTPSWVIDDATMAAWRHGMPFVLPPTPSTADSIFPAWAAPNGENHLLLEHIKATDTYANIDVGGMGVDTQQGMDIGIRTLLPFTSGQIHINWRDNPGWNLPTTIQLTRELGFKGMYVVEARSTNDPYAITDGLRETILSNI